MKTPLVDQHFGAQVYMDAMHNRTHEGFAYSMSFYEAAVGNGTSVTMMIRTPSDVELHVTSEVATSGNASIIACEGITAATSAQEMTPLTKNRESLKTSGARIWAYPVVAATGTTIYYNFIPGGTKTFAVGGGSGNRDEWILKPGTDYLWQITNISGSAAIVSGALEYYEVEEED